MREGIQRPHRAICGGSGGAQPAGSLFDAAPGYPSARSMRCGSSWPSCRTARSSATNLALYAAYASDFQTAEEESKERAEPDIFATLTTGLRADGPGPAGRGTPDLRDRLARINEQGASFANSGLGDLAAHQGLYRDAVKMLRAWRGQLTSPRRTPIGRRRSSWRSPAHT